MDGPTKYSTLRQDAKVKKMRDEIDTLKKEKEIERLPTSVTIADFLTYVKKNMPNDWLLRKPTFKDSIQCCVI